MDYAFEQKVRERAYEIWQSAGMSDGLAETHWFTAEQSVKSETQAPTKARAKIAKSAVPAATKKEAVSAATSSRKPAAKAKSKSSPRPKGATPVKARETSVSSATIN